MTTAPFQPQPMPSATALGVAAPLGRALRLIQSYLIHRRPALGLALVAPAAARGAGPPLVEITGTVLWPVPTLTPPPATGLPPVAVPRAALPVIIVNAGCWTARLAVLGATPGDTGCRFGLLTAPSHAGGTAGLGLQWTPLPLTGPETPTGQSLGDWLIDMVDEGLDWDPIPTEMPPPAL